ncbi:poly(A)-specific ribonuclease PARN-like isoform X1 [Chenopodium quinoa]|uniref:poly(A)-specific ribonuclease PARN-like isoform X1 n=2 Tax=Chenopodium quinoa TaxID=63459 RepID=UPI000B77AEB2|nr:poly(A)-specific ribonuclease PARN-like isoform X1 [Chenopodium quinoa]
MKKLTRVSPISLSSALIRTLTSSSISTTNFSLKNVTKSNFEETLVDLTTHVKAADFVAIDLEMTGVTSSPWRESFEFDRYDVRYLKIKDSAEKFAVVQFGVCPFRWDSFKNSFIAHPHNFYIFPRQELPTDGPSYEFLCQTSSIDFLAQYQFDFNTCIHEGVSYLSRGQEDEALSRLNSIYNGKWQNVNEVRDIPLSNVADVLFSERMKNRLSGWHDMLLLNRNANAVLPSAVKSKQQFETIFFNMRPALRLNGFTSHQLKLMELVIRKHFKDLVLVRAHDESSILQKLVVYVESDDDKIKLMEEIKDESHQHARRKVKAAAGFRHVIDLLCAENKLIVGHNCFLDMAHIYHKFFGPLPSTVEEFVLNIHNSFSQIVDTKVLLNADASLQKCMNKASTSLASSFSLMCPEIASGKSSVLGIQPCVKVEVQVDDMRSSNWNSGARHEAGYDAFMTGCIFAQACSHLGVDFSSEKVLNSENLQKYVNQLYLSWSSGDVINLSTGDVNEIPVINSVKRRFLNIMHPSIVLIWGFRPKLRASQIKNCICKVFGIHSVACIYNLDETAVFVQFSTADLAASFLALKESLETSDDSISVLHPLSKLLEGGKTRAAGYEVYKDICSSPISKVLFAEQAEATGINWKTKLIDIETDCQNLEPEKITEKTERSSLSPEICKATKSKIDVHKCTSDQNVFDKILYSPDSEADRELKVTSSCCS